MGACCSNDAKPKAKVGKRAPRTLMPAATSPAKGEAEHHAAGGEDETEGGLFASVEDADWGVVTEDGEESTDDAGSMEADPRRASHLGTELSRKRLNSGSFKSSARRQSVHKPVPRLPVSRAEATALLHRYLKLLQTPSVLDELCEAFLHTKGRGNLPDGPPCTPHSPKSPAALQASAAPRVTYGDFTRFLARTRRPVYLGDGTKLSSSLFSHPDVSPGVLHAFLSSSFAFDPEPAPAPVSPRRLSSKPPSFPVQQYSFAAPDEALPKTPLQAARQTSFASSAGADDAALGTKALAASAKHAQSRFLTATSFPGAARFGLVAFCQALQRAIAAAPAHPSEIPAHFVPAQHLPNLHQYHEALSEDVGNLALQWLFRMDVLLEVIQQYSEIAVATGAMPADVYGLPGTRRRESVGCVSAADEEDVDGGAGAGQAALFSQSSRNLQDLFALLGVAAGGLFVKPAAGADHSGIAHAVFLRVYRPSDGRRRDSLHSDLTDTRAEASQTSPPASSRGDGRLAPGPQSPRETPAPSSPDRSEHRPQHGEGDPPGTPREANGGNSKTPAETENGRSPELRLQQQQQQQQQQRPPGEKMPKQASPDADGVLERKLSRSGSRTGSRRQLGGRKTSSLAAAPPRGGGGARGEKQPKAAAGHQPHSPTKARPRAPRKGSSGSHAAGGATRSSKKAQATSSPTLDPSWATGAEGTPPVQVEGPSAPQPQPPQAETVEEVLGDAGGKLCAAGLAALDGRHPEVPEVFRACACRRDDARVAMPKSRLFAQYAVGTLACIAEHSLSTASAAQGSTQQDTPPTPLTTSSLLEDLFLCPGYSAKRRQAQPGGHLAPRKLSATVPTEPAWRVPALKRAGGCRPDWGSVSTGIVLSSRSTLCKLRCLAGTPGAVRQLCDDYNAALEKRVAPPQTSSDLEPALPRRSSQFQPGIGDGPKLPHRAATPLDVSRVPLFRALSLLRALAQATSAELHPVHCWVAAEIADAKKLSFPSLLRRVVDAFDREAQVRVPWGPRCPFEIAYRRSTTRVVTVAFPAGRNDPEDEAALVRQFECTDVESVMSGDECDFVAAPPCDSPPSRKSSAASVTPLKPAKPASPKGAKAKSKPNGKPPAEPAKAGETPPPPPPPDCTPAARAEKVATFLGIPNALALACHKAFQVVASPGLIRAGEEPGEHAGAPADLPPPYEATPGGRGEGFDRIEEGGGENNGGATNGGGGGGGGGGGKKRAADAAGPGRGRDGLGRPGDKADAGAANNGCNNDDSNGNCDNNNDDKNNSSNNNNNNHTGNIENDKSNSNHNNNNDDNSNNNNNNDVSNSNHNSNNNNNNNNDVSNSNHKSNNNNNNNSSSNRNLNNNNNNTASAAAAGAAAAAPPLPGRLGRHALSVDELDARFALALLQQAVGAPLLDFTRRYTRALRERLGPATGVLLYPDFARLTLQFLRDVVLPELGGTSPPEARDVLQKFNAPSKRLRATVESRALIRRSIREEMHSGVGTSEEGVVLEGVDEHTFLTVANLLAKRSGVSQLDTLREFFGAMFRSAAVDGEVPFLFLEELVALSLEALLSRADDNQKHPSPPAPDKPAFDKKPYSKAKPPALAPVVDPPGETAGQPSLVMPESPVGPSGGGFPAARCGATLRLSAGTGRALMPAVQKLRVLLSPDAGCDWIVPFLGHAFGTGAPRAPGWDDCQRSDDDLGAQRGCSIAASDDPPSRSPLREIHPRLISDDDIRAVSDIYEDNSPTQKSPVGKRRRSRHWTDDEASDAEATLKGLSSKQFATPVHRRTFSDHDSGSDYCGVPSGVRPASACKPSAIHLAPRRSSIKPMIQTTPRGSPLNSPTSAARKKRRIITTGVRFTPGEVVDVVLWDGTTEPCVVARSKKTPNRFDLLVLDAGPDASLAATYRQSPPRLLSPDAPPIHADSPLLTSPSPVGYAGSSSSLGSPGLPPRGGDGGRKSRLVVLHDVDPTRVQPQLLRGPAKPWAYAADVLHRLCRVVGAPPACLAYSTPRYSHATIPAFSTDSPTENVWGLFVHSQVEALVEACCAYNLFHADVPPLQANDDLAGNSELGSPGDADQARFGCKVTRWDWGSGFAHIESACGVQRDSMEKLHSTTCDLTLLLSASSPGLGASGRGMSFSLKSSGSSKPLLPSSLPPPIGKADVDRARLFWSIPLGAAVVASGITRAAPLPELTLPHLLHLCNLVVDEIGVADGPASALLFDHFFSSPFLELAQQRLVGRVEDAVHSLTFLSKPYEAAPCATTHGVLFATVLDTQSRATKVRKLSREPAAVFEGHIAAHLGEKPKTVEWHVLVGIFRRLCAAIGVNAVSFEADDEASDSD
ncbi:hypothetical protein DIPPA_28318 [Diplonema papillatum]|nr:hypothetical protein DIPPA_28318 [Diplonema papillatum]